MTSQMIEFHRFGDTEGALSRGNRYIRTAGWDTPALEVSPGLDYKTLLGHLNVLRYEDLGDARDQAEAREALAAEAARLLPPVGALDQGLLQIDLVTPSRRSSRRAPTGCSTPIAASC
jgi:hypothetical protein